MHKHNISIVIPTYNEGKYLEKTLKSISNQSIGYKELIIVDGHSNDNTLSIAKDYNAKILFDDRRGIGYARNLGFKHANGHIIVSASADVIYDKEWLEHLTKHFPEYGAVAGSIYVKGNAIENASAYLLNNVLVPLAYAIGFVFSSADNIAIKQSIYKKIGNVLEEFKTAEDTILIKKAKEYCKIKFEKKAKAYTSLRRIRKWGYIRYLIFHTKNFFKVNLGLSAEKEYEPVRD